MYSFFTVNFLFLGCLFLRVARWGGALIGGVARWGGALFGGVARWGGVLFGGVAHLIGGCGEVALLIDMSEIDDAPEKVRCILPSSSEEALFSCALNCCNNCSLAYRQKHTQGAIVKLLPRVFLPRVFLPALQLLVSRPLSAHESELQRSTRNE